MPPADEDDGFDLNAAGAMLVAWCIFALLALLTWHARGAMPWERPLMAELIHHPLPGSRLVVFAFEPAAFVLITAGLAWIAWTSGRLRLAVAGAAGSVAAIVLTEYLLKPLIDRHHRVGGAGVFPSGHVTAAAACAMFAWFVFNRWRGRALFVAVPLVASWVVVSLRMHYPADAIGGVIVGGTVVSAAILVRPVGALARLMNVVHDTLVADVDDLRDVVVPRSGTRTVAVGREVLGERPQDAGDGLLFFDRQEAPVPVGDDAEPMVD
jgi:membrane-associated phospholipid phosphatase